MSKSTIVPWCQVVSYIRACVQGGILAVRVLLLGQLLLSLEVVTYRIGYNTAPRAQSLQLQEHEHPQMEKVYGQHLQREQQQQQHQVLLQELSREHALELHPERNPATMLLPAEKIGHVICTRLYQLYSIRSSCRLRSVWPCGTPCGNTIQGPDRLRSAPITDPLSRFRDPKPIS
jgi:hypothetical protein